MRSLEWFRRVKRSDETENITAVTVAGMNMVGKRPRGKPKSRLKDMIPWKMKETQATDREK